MRKTLALVTLLGCLTLCVPTLAGGRQMGWPHRFVPEAQDGGLVQIDNPVDGRTWSAWAYRNGPEYDLALSFTRPDGSWSEPTFIGLDDGSDQIQPAFARDRFGTLYLAFTDRAANAIRLTTLRVGESRWSAALMLTNPVLQGRSPSLAVVADRLVVAFRSDQRVLILDMPLPEPEPTNSTQGINDGPDPTGLTDDEDDHGNGNNGKGNGNGNSNSSSGDGYLPLPNTGTVTGDPN